MESKETLIPIKSKESILKNQKKTKFFSKIFFSNYSNSSDNEEKVFPQYTPMINGNINFISLLRKILKIELFHIIFVMILSFLTFILETFQYIFLRKLMLSFNSSDTHLMFRQCIIFILVRIGFSLSRQHKVYQENMVSIYISNQLTSIIYNKVIIEQETLQKEIGKIINYIQFDGETIAFLFCYAPSSIIVPFQIGFSFYTIAKICPYSNFCLILIGILLVSMLIGYLIQRFYFINSTKFSSAKDERINATHQAFKNFREIKFNRYEEIVYTKILQKRTKELEYFRNMQDEGVLNNFVFFSLPHIFSIFMFTFIIYFIAPNYAYNTPDLLTILLIFNSLSYPLYRFPVFITCIVEAWVSLKRIGNFIENKNKEKAITFNLVPEINSNERVCILGENGSGKTTLIKTLLLNSKAKISYASQEHFIMNNSIKENILFGSPLEKEKYENILKLSEMDYDISMMKDNDNTVCGINGEKISGGQRARVDIARALYHNDSKLFIFDDSFANLDEGIAQRVFNNSLNNIDKSKGIIMVFSNINFIKEQIANSFDRFIYTKDFKCAFDGNYSAFSKTQFFQKVISDETCNPKNNKNKSKEESTKVEKKPKEIIKNFEKDKRHEISLKKIFFHLGTVPGIGLVIVPILFEILEIMRVYYISKPDKMNSIKEIKNYILSYDTICIFCIIFLLLREFLLYETTYLANIKLHNKMLVRLLKSSMNQHIQIPNSEKINHLNKDLSRIKYPLKFFTYSLKYGLSLLVTTLLCLKYSYIFLTISFLVFVSFSLLKGYLPRNISFNHKERQSRAPVIALTTDSFNGSIYIKSYNVSKYFYKELYERLNMIIQDNMNKFGSNSWYNLTIDMLGCLFITIIVSFCIFKGGNREDIGLLINYSVALVECVLNLMSSVINYFNDKVPLDRVDEYTELPVEENQKNQKSGKVNFDGSEIVFQNFFLRYNENTEYVLKDISFSILPKEKLAIIGRTGSGKSSILSSLLRIVQGNKLIKGSIQIGSKKIYDIDLYNLRDNISVVPQIPYILNGTLRENIDPKYKYSDKILIGKIYEMQFMQNILKKYPQLNSKISSNKLSMGERQLICFCRAILKNNKILVLDESTANVDIKTEKEIFRTLKDLNDCIIISVMHKLDYMNLFDKCLVMNNGEVKYYGNFENYKDFGN